ncbi:hypothetical protein GGX14DRAFT_608378 [Mycena pura]|uniref:Uncharacterized protein n=1 Tax=Mycena pura TaxID=153505 RepID=A0AAD6VP56_9AGAR|nr:hypothetical protein GGX14DRAFT_608378 [Mycena pura]
MLRQMCRRGRLLAAIKDSTQEVDSKSPVVAAMQILSPPGSVDTDLANLQQLPPAEGTAFNGSGVVLADSMYELILEYWNNTYSPSYIHKSDLTFDLLNSGVKVLPSRAVQLTHFTHKIRLFSPFKKHHGNSSISFRHPSTGQKDMGFIRSIWTQVLEGQKRTFVFVQPHTDTDPVDAAKMPYLTHPRFKCTVKYTNPRHPKSELIVEPRHIISHVAYLPCPQGTFDIQKAITIFVDSLHRNRD